MSEGRSETERRLLDEARRWWEGRRPHSMTAEQHAKNPTVNCASARDQNLARAVAAHIGRDVTP